MSEYFVTIGDPGQKWDGDFCMAECNFYRARSYFYMQSCSVHFFGDEGARAIVSLGTSGFAVGSAFGDEFLGVGGYYRPDLEIADSIRYLSDCPRIVGFSEHLTLCACCGNMTEIIYDPSAEPFRGFYILEEFEWAKKSEMPISVLRPLIAARVKKLSGDPFKKHICSTCSDALRDGKYSDLLKNHGRSKHAMPCIGKMLKRRLESQTKAESGRKKFTGTTENIFGRINAASKLATTIKNERQRPKIRRAAIH